MATLSHLRRVLVVEDDYLIAQDMVDTFEKNGCAEAKIVPTLQEAMTEIAAGADFVTLDIKLADGDSGGLAEMLDQSNIPFIYVTGYSPDTDQMLPNRPYVLKPATESELLNGVKNALAGHSRHRPKQPRSRVS